MNATLQCMHRNNFPATSLTSFIGMRGQMFGE